MSQSDWVPFVTKCPSCENNKKIKWVHSSDQYTELIDKNGNIKCNNTSCKYHREPAFIMEWKFDCGKHLHGTYYEPKANYVFLAIGILSTIQTLSKEESDNLYQRIMNYKKQ